MLIKTLNNNSIEITNSIFGNEVVKYNGKLVSQRRSLGGGLHIFKEAEDQEEVQYEVEFINKWHGLGFYLIIRRNGVIIFSNK